MVDQEIIQQLQELGHTLDFSQAKVGKWQKRGLRPETRQLLESRFIALEIRGKEARGLWWVCTVSFWAVLKKDLGLVEQAIPSAWAAWKKDSRLYGEETMGFCKYPPSFLRGFEKGI